ncbi:unnamed protein product [Sphagnum compactum]
MEKISVTVRVRPLSKAEAAKGSPWKLGPNSIALCNASGSSISGQSYTFDRVFGSDATTLEIYEAHTKDIIGSAVQGFNGTVFAYGQTSSGKTYTMRGSPQEPGIIPLAVHEVFRNIQAVDTREFLLRVSYMEIYNEEINDLLAPEAQKLQIHENVERGIFVAGLREEIVVSPEQVLELMEFGENHRHVGETNMNVYSSRSHTIFRMVIESRDRSQDDPCGNNSVQVCDAVRVSVLNLVDLAGSERVAKSGAEGARLKEGTHINKSLMTLGTVINKLSEGIQKQGGHVPYRDSKLTRILQPALGGNAKTAIICNVTPALVHTDETKGTLYFASRANRVTNCAQVNEIMTDAALLKRQKKEIEELRTKLQESHSEHWEEEVLHLRNALLKTELDRERMALELQEEKKAQAERERRLREQEQKIENLSTMVINSAVDDRDFDKRSKKNNRRETWCPRIPAEAPDNVEKEVSRGPFGSSVLPTKRERQLCLPPPFEKLCEEEDTMLSSFKEEEEDGAVETPTMEAYSDSDNTFLEPDLVNVGERRRRASVDKEITLELKQEIGYLQAQYDDLQYDSALKMQEKMIEIEELKKELVNAQMAASKVRKLDDNFLQAPEVQRRVRSLDGCEADSSLKQLRAQVRNLEMEKTYMQKELDGLTEEANCHAITAREYLEEVKKELHDTRKEAAIAQHQLSLALVEIKRLQNDNEKALILQTELISSFDELKCEVEAGMSIADSLQSTFAETTQSFALYQRYFQDALLDVKLSSSILNETLEQPQNRFTALMKEHTALQLALEAVQNQRDTFCQASKSADKELKAFEVEVRKQQGELEQAEAKLESANAKILGATNEVVKLQELLLQRDKEFQVLEHNLKDLEAEAFASTEDVERHSLEQRVKVLEQALQEAATEKAHMIQKGETMQVTIQVLEGERDALIETSKQAQADMDRLQGKRRQELKEAQNKLESAQTDTLAVVEQLRVMDSFLAQKEVESQALQQKFQAVQAENESIRTAMAKSASEWDKAKQMHAEEKLAFNWKEEELDSNANYEHSTAEGTAISESPEVKLAEAEHVSPVLSQGKEIATENAERAAEEMASLRIKVNVLEHEHSILIKESSFLCPCPKVVHVVIMLKCFLLLVSQELQATTAEKISAKAELDALQEEKLRLQREEDALKVTVALAETERMLIKKQNDEAQEELKALDEELARQRRDNEEVVSALEEANSAAAQAALVTKELQLRLSETEDRRQFLEEEIVHLKSEAAAAKADLESRTCELQLVEKNLELARSECSSSRVENEEMGTLLSQKNATLEMLSIDMQNLETQFAAVKQELAVRVHELEESVFENSEEKLALLKKQELLQSTLRKVEGERDDLQKSCEVIQHDMNRLAEKMEQQETQLTDRISELKQLHFTEAAQLRSDILVLRKELNAAKSAPAALEKERDGLGKELEKLKVKMKDIEAKLKSTLIEKSKVEAEKVNIDRELKQLRQSTALLNKRESIVDKRRESIATGLNKTKAQLSTAEHALQMKTIELEKTSFDLQLSQDTYAKLEFAMSEMECDLTAVKEKLAEAEMAITVLGQEKESAADGMEKVAKELEVALEQQRVTAAELEALQAEHLSLVLKLQDCGTASKDAEKLAKDLALEKDKLTQQLTDAFFEFEDEKAAWALLRSNHDADLEDQQECQRKLEEAIAFEKEKLERSQVNCKDLEEQIVYANSTLKGEHDARMKLSEEVEKLQLQLRSAIGVKETLLSELDNAGMNIKTLGLEVDELQAQLDKVSLERKSLRLQTAELNSRMEELNKQLQDSTKELKQAQDKGSLLEKENDDYFTQNLKLEVGLDAVRNRMEVFQGRWEDAEVDIIELKEQRQNAESSLAASRLEVVELHVEVENLRRQCQNCEDELQMVKRNESRPEKELERQKQVAEVISQNETLQLQVRKAEQNNKALWEEIRKLQEILKTKEAAIIDLKANLDKLEGQTAKFELELVSEQGEVLSGQKLGATMIPPTTSAMPNKETQMADAPPAVGKSVQELKMLTGRLFKKLQMSRGLGNDLYTSNACEDPPPPSATLQSRPEALTLPVRKKPHTESSAAVAAEARPFSTGDNNLNSLSSGFIARRAVLTPLNQQHQNKGPSAPPIQTMSWEKKPQQPNAPLNLKLPMHPPASAGFRSSPPASDKENF